MNSILAPFGEPIEARPQVPSREELLEMKEGRGRLKDERRMAAREGAVEVEEMVVDEEVD